MNSKTFYLTAILLLNSLISLGQQVIGFWEITEVKMGSQTMTPVAKWTKINKDGTYQSGNGWLQNAEGTWTFDRKKSLFSPKETNGLIDEFGPFTVEFTDNGMNWLREEEGTIVTVTLKRINSLPKGPADEVVGLWNLISVTKAGMLPKLNDEVNGTQNIFIRWDRIYISRSSQGARETGYWHMHGHKPEITLLPHDKNGTAETWRIEITESVLSLTGISDSNKDEKIVYYRLHRFPK